MSHKILLVEDNELNRDMLTRRLVRYGFMIIPAVDGQEAIDLAKSSQPDIILLDMSLPVIDGWDAAKLLKASADTKRIPIIALTAHAMAGDKAKALNAGCDDYETKPVEINKLITKIQRLL